MSQESELGTLVVVVLKARNLIDKHSFYKQDVFAQASFNGINKKTQVDVKGGQHPVWDAEFRFTVMGAVADKTRKMEISCFAKEPRSDDLLGKGTIDITNTLRTGEFDDWINLDINGVVRGEVYLEMTYFSSKPAPVLKPSAPSLAVPFGQGLTRRPSKLPPSERLYRPPQILSPRPTPIMATDRLPNLNSSAQPSRPRAHSNSPPKGNGSALPPLPEDLSGQATLALPGILMPGGTSRPKPQVPPPSSGPPPSLLRPRNGNASLSTTLPLDRARLSVSPPLDPLPLGQPSPLLNASPHNNASSTPNPYLTGPPPTSTTLSAFSPQKIPTIPMTNYPQFTSTFVPQAHLVTSEVSYAPNFSTIPSFPVPAVFASQHNPTYSPYGHQLSYDENRPGPYPETRYQNPLPLPPQSELKTIPNPLDTSKLKLQADMGRLSTLKRVEEEAARRQEQEQKDLQLALQLDKELNS